MTSGKSRRHYTSLCKIKIMIARPTMRSNGWGINLFIFNFTTMFIQPRFQPSSCLTNIAKITRRTWNKINATPVLNRNRIFRRRKFNFDNRSKRDFETKTGKDFRDFERERSIKRQNYKIETWVRRRGSNNRAYFFFFWKTKGSASDFEIIFPWHLSVIQSYSFIGRN